MSVFLKQRQVFLNLFFWMPAARPEFHQRGIDHHAMEPGGDAAAGFEVSNGAEDRDEGVLQCVARLIVIAQEAPRHAQEWRRVVADELLEGIGLARAKPRDEGGFARVTERGGHGAADTLARA